MRRATDRPSRVLGYARVSSPDQALGTSLQDQQDAITAYAKARGLAVTRFFVEAESAIYEKVERREQIQHLLKEVRAGDLIVCDKLDRWSRDPEFTYRSVREILEVDAAFYAVGDGCDPATAEGDTMLGFRVLFAREEHKRIKLRLVGTRQLLRDKGYYAEGLPPFGYKRTKPKGQRGLDKNILLVIEDDAEHVRDAFRRCIRGESIDDIRKHLLRVRRARSWDKKVIGHILRNRVYVGEARDSRGVWIKSHHVPIIAPDVFDKAQAALDGRRLGGAKSQAESHTKDWLMRDIGRCAQCDAKVSAAYGSRHGKPDYSYYYRCGKRCGVRYIPVDSADTSVRALVAQRLTELRALISSGEEPARPVAVVDFAEKKAKLQRKRERILEAYTDGDMTKDELHASLAKVDAAKRKAEGEEAAQLRAAPFVGPAARRQVLAHIGEIQKAWKRVPVARQREVLRELATAVRLERDREPVVVWRTPEEIAGNLRL